MIHITGGLCCILTQVAISSLVTALLWLSDLFPTTTTGKLRLSICVDWSRNVLNNVGTCKNDSRLVKSNITTRPSAPRKKAIPRVANLSSPAVSHNWIVTLCISLATKSAPIVCLYCGRNFLKANCIQKDDLPVQASPITTLCSKQMIGLNTIQFLPRLFEQQVLQV